MLRRVGLIGVMTVTALLAFGGTAWAHVTVDPLSAPQGSTVKLSFLAPNEEPPNLFNKLQIFFPVPPATPIPTVNAEPKTGWTVAVKTQHLAKPIVTDDGSITDIVSEVDWTADSDASAIGKNQFGEFTVDADGLPDHGTEVVFKALQTYSNGDVVRWIEPIPAKGDAPEHPTPVLQLTNPNPAASKPATTTVTATAVKTKDNSARTLAAIALVVSIIALVGVGIALLRKKPPTTA